MQELKDVLREKKKKLNSSPHNLPMSPVLHHHHHHLLLLLLLLFLTFSQFYSTTAQSRQLNISLNSSLSPTTNPTSWLSSSGRFAFGFYPQVGGFAVGVWLIEPSGNWVIVWTANRDDPPVSSDARLLLTSDRGIVLESGGQDPSISRVDETAFMASMLDSGNFVLYNSDSRIIWETFSSPTDTILCGQRLLSGKRLVSSTYENNHSSGRFKFAMQTDGNLVLYPIRGIGTVDDAYWASNTYGAGNNVTLNLDESGFMYMLNNTGFIIRNLTNPPTQRNTTDIYRATLDIDGIVRLYVHRFMGNGSMTTLMVKVTSISQACEVKGSCGFNSYCVTNGTQANCLCPQGYYFVDPIQRTRGCERKFVVECRGKEGVKYDIFSMPNSVWNNNPYETVLSMSEDRCREACLQDCYCEAAHYSAGNCYKQKLPLQYWRRKLDDSTTTFVKFASGNENQMNYSLSPNSNPRSWQSPSRRFSFGFYPQGNGFAVGVWLAGPSGETVVVWTANRDDPPLPVDAILLLSSDGRLLLQSRGQYTPISNVTEAASSASMLDTGNFVLYNSNSSIIWQTFDSPTDTLLAGQVLLTGRELFSSVSEKNHSTGRFRLKMQNNGNLVLYPFKAMDSTKESIWNTGTDKLGNNVALHLNNNGQIFMVNSSGINIRNMTESLNPPSRTATVIIYRAMIDFGGIFRLYSHSVDRNGNSKMIEEWANPLRHCEVKAFCGINSYCTQNDTEAYCTCPRGFDFIEPGQKFQGCVKNFIEDDCRGKKGTVTYNIDSIKNTSWEDNPYSILSMMSEEECREACLQDCNCGAATFKDTACSKQKLPLRYGRSNLNDATTSLIKYSTDSWAGPDGPMPRTQGSRGRKVLRLEILIIIIAVMACFFVSMAILGFLIYRRRIWKCRIIPEATNKGLRLDEFTQSFTYDELEKATNGFKEELGKGAFGTVYKGALSNGTRMVAVKRLDGVLEEGEKEFQTEMSAIGKTHHRNLVRLLGFCADGPHRLLVYEYMSNGSLANLLFSRERRPNWDERVRIAMDIAKGIIYLHEECESPIIHCDIKPQNILMDEFYRAKISDFGLAKLMKPDQTRTFTGIRGTRGYVAPEWHRNMPVTIKADVYSFGVVLLEIICCRRNIEIQAEDEEKILCYWVYDCFGAGELQKLVNFEAVDKRNLENMVKVGLWCIQDKPSLRPPMKRVVMMLEGTEDVPTPPLTSFLNSP